MQAGSNRFLTAAWLLWIQAVCQLYPLPRNLGRAGLVSMIGLFAAEASDALQVRLLRRSLQLIAIVTILIAMASLIVDADDVLPKWPVLAVVSVMLWVSSTHHDLYDWIASIHVAKTDPISQRYGNGVEVTESVPEKARRYDPSKQSANVQWVSAVADSVRMYRKRKRARAVWKREREEASDAARLDQVLKQVSEFGTAGLSAEDKALLNRVSEALRKHRQTEHDNAPGRKDQD
jgi:hypothetical protein